MKKVNLFSSFLFAVFLACCAGCQTNNIIDTNVELPKRNWTYVNRVKATVDIQDASKAFNLRFKLRHTAEYNYRDIFILMHLSGGGQPKVTRRYRYKLAEADGQWLGTGSGNLYHNNLPLLTGYRFPAAGKYTIEIEQNMRDNPLKQITDVGIQVVAVPL